MSRVRWIIIILAAIVVSAGCSKKQEEAAKLEAEMTGEQTAADTTADTVRGVADLTEAMVAEDTTTENAVAPMPSRPQGEGFTVQVASCESEDYARYLVELYQGRGYEPFVTQITYDGELFNRVRIGAFESFSEAEQLKTELNDRYSLDSWVDTYAN